MKFFFSHKLMYKLNKEEIEYIEKFYKNIHSYFSEKFIKYFDFLIKDQNIKDIETLKVHIKNKIVLIEKELKEEKIINNKMKEKIKLLEDYINKIELEKNKNKKKILEKEKFDFMIINENNLNNQIIKLNKQLEEKVNEIKKIHFNYKSDLFIDKNLISVIIASEDESIIDSFICKKTDKFSKIEDSFYENHPEYNETNNDFYVGRKKIKRNKTLLDNEIYNNSIIIVKKCEED